MVSCLPGSGQGRLVDKHRFVLLAVLSSAAGLRLHGHAEVHLGFLPQREPTTVDRHAQRVGKQTLGERIVMENLIEVG